MGHKQKSHLLVYKDGFSNLTLINKANGFIGFGKDLKNPTNRLDNCYMYGHCWQAGFYGWLFCLPDLVKTLHNFSTCTVRTEFEKGH